MIAGALAFVALASADAFGVLARGKYGPVEIACAGLSLLLLALALVLRRPWPALWGVGFAGAAYATGRAGHTSIDTRAVAVGVLLLLAAELATWSIDAHARFEIEWRVHARRGAIVTVVAACAAGIDAFVLAAAGVSVTPSAALAAVGVAAAAGAVALVVLARS